jgi:putative DNA primase/helicase
MSEVIWMRTPPEQVYPKARTKTGVNFAAIPAELKGYLSWCVWRQEERHGDFTKVPYIAGEEPERRASTTDSRTWRAFPEARGAYELGGFDGLGFVFSSGDQFVGIDLDKCHNPETGQLEEWAAEFVTKLGGYVEVSPSGRGVHIIVRGDLGVALGVRKRAGRVEAYSARRFFTVTGARL